MSPCPRCGADVPAGGRFCSACGLPTEQTREERRIVTVLFGDLAGYTELAEARDAEEVKGILDGAFAASSRVIVEYGGRVDKIIGDEIMAVFGAPQAHEDDPERAVRAALAMRRELATYSQRLEAERGIPLVMHIGVNTGEVVAGYVGGNENYTVLGDAVNTARRIEDAAEPGQILVGRATYEASRQAIAYRSVGGVRAKGKRLAVAVWEAVGERALPGERTPRAAPLIGREEELAVLDSLLAIVRRDGRPTTVTLVGDAGMGKSRVASEFARRIAADGVRVLIGRALPYGTSSPAFAVQEILRGALLIDPSADQETTRAWIAGRLEDLGLSHEVDRAATFLGLGGHVPARAGDATPGRSSAPGEASALLDSASAVLERIAQREGALVLTLQDLHWGEDAVLDFVERLQGVVRAPLLVLCLARPTLLERRPGWGGRVGSALLPVEPLARERAAEMLDVLAPALPLAMREGVLDRAGGNPFYLEELSRLLLDRPHRAAEDVQVPGSIQALVATRLDGLPDRAKRLVQDAAVIGDEFWLGALTALGVADAQATLDTPQVRELIEAIDDGGPPGGYRFRQTLMREVAYASVPKQVRAGHHATVAAWLEGASPDAATNLDDLIAYHYERAAGLAREVGEDAPDAAAKARDFLERAGDRALGMDAARTAARFFGRAIAFARDDADAVALRIRLCEALVGSWRNEEAEPELQAVLADARRLGERLIEGKALRLLGDSLRMQGKGEVAREPLERSLAIARELGDVAEEAASLRARGQLELFQGRWSSATEWFEQALARYRELGDRRGEGWSLQNLGWAAMFIGDIERALEHFRKGEEIFVELGDEEGIGWCISMRGWALLVRGEVMEAGRIAEMMEHLLAEERPEYLLGAEFTLVLQRILRAYVAVMRARLGEAESRIADAFRGADLGSATWAQALGHYPLFLVAIMRRRLDDAETASRRELEAARAFGDPFYEGQAAYARALLLFERGDVDGCERALDEMAGPDERGRAWSANAATRWLRARILRARGSAADARALLEADVGRQGIALISPARVRAFLGQLMIDTGDAAGAIEVVRAAIDQAGEEVIGRAIGLRTLARALVALDRPDEAEKALREELSLLDDADWELERVRALGVLAQALDAQGRFDEAGEALDRARAMLAEQPLEADVAGLAAALRG